MKKLLYYIKIYNDNEKRNWKLATGCIINSGRLNCLKERQNQRSSQGKLREVYMVHKFIDLFELNWKRQTD